MAKLTVRKSGRPLKCKLSPTTRSETTSTSNHAVKRAQKGGCKHPKDIQTVDDDDDTGNEEDKQRSQMSNLLEFLGSVDRKPDPFFVLIPYPQLYGFELPLQSIVADGLYAMRQQQAQVNKIILLAFTTHHLGSSIYSVLHPTLFSN